MREIKFRAWDRKSQRMFENVSTGTLTVFGNNHEHADHEDCVFMQYTGLKDKNGKEVYEGDIVKCTEGCPHEVKWFEDNGGTFIGGMPGFNLDGLQRGGGYGYAWTEVEEIIGNIYKNPELLNPHTT